MRTALVLIAVLLALGASPLPVEAQEKVVTPAPRSKDPPAKKQTPKKVKRPRGEARFCTIDIFGQQCCQSPGGSVACSGGGPKEK
jgi:hypothetical protein